MRFSRINRNANPQCLRIIDLTVPKSYKKGNRNLVSLHRFLLEEKEKDDEAEGDKAAHDNTIAALPRRNLAD